MAVMLFSGVHSNPLLSCPHRALPTDPQVLPQGAGSGSLGKEGSSDTLKALLTLESVPGTKQNKNK